MHLIWTRSWVNRTLPFVLCWALTGGSSLNAATYTVVTTADSGSGSLRQAILDANENPGPDQIRFNISGSGVRTISPGSPLPAITDPAQIDGTTQPTFRGTPVIELNGANAGPVAGLRLLAGNTTIRGLILNRFGGDGIRIEGLGTNTIQANYVGLDAGGVTDRGNAAEGIFISGSWHNLVGGEFVTNRNVISGNGDAGVYVLGGGNNVVAGNYIGSSRAGSAKIPNSNNGLIIYNSVSNTVGGASVGMRNVLSGNGGSGIYLFGSGSRGNVIQGNYVGLNASGGLVLSNVADGITISGAPANLVGGTHEGTGNMISGNGKGGVFITGVTATGNQIKGNRIGSDLAGNGILGNNLSGVVLSNAHSNYIGGIEPRAGNLISGNTQDGILILTNSSGNRIEGNIIGANASGSAPLRNGFNGVTISGAHSNFIGGVSAAARNLISGNQFHGVQILNASSGNVVSGNHVGTDLAGAVAVPNRHCGVRLDSASTTVGGLNPLQRNVISGNLTNGVFLVGVGASNNVVSGNYIGLNSAGTAALPNGVGGVGLSAAPGNIISDNVISGNRDAGVYLIGSTATGNRITGNRIGTDHSGWLAIGNNLEGIYIDSCGTNEIGGPAGLGNLVSGNRARGIYLVNAPGNSLRGNWVGLASDGTSDLGNVFHGIECGSGSHNNHIGGNSPADANRIGFSKTVYTGVRIRDGASGNSILHNRIFSNGALGIDLGPVNAAANDACDADAGANDGQNYPVLTKAISGTGTLIRGSLNSRASREYRLQFFASASADATGFGEGAVCLGEHRVRTAGNCSVEFSILLPATVEAGEAITATATDDAGNTSEFSRAIVAETIAAPTIQASSGGLSISWPIGATAFVLKSAGSLAPPVQWTTVAATPVQAAGKYHVNLPFPAAGTNQFFVLAYE